MLISGWALPPSTPHAEIPDGIAGPRGIITVVRERDRRSQPPGARKPKRRSGSENLQQFGVACLWFLIMGLDRPYHPLEVFIRGQIES